MKSTVSRWVIRFLSALIITMILASLSFIVLEADHDCHGENCHVCDLIIQCDNNVRYFGYLVLCFVIAVTGIAACSRLFLPRIVHPVLLTWVSSKVRMNN